MNRTDGYTRDVSYPAFFHKEMQPLWLSSVAGFLGFATPDPGAPFRACELGCGVGINLLVAAACHPQAQFVGVDFNERHLQIAADAARASGLRNIAFIHTDFAGFAAGNHGLFDYITSHGVWSWIAPQHRAGLLGCVAGGLAPGGLFQLHYMCHPGATDMLAVQHTLNLFAHHVPGSSAQRAQAGLRLLQQLGERGLFVDRPGVLAKLQALQQRDPADVAHEYLTDHWQPQHAVDVHQQAGQAGLHYLGSADVFNNLDPALSIPGRLQDAVRQIASPMLAETIKDMARNSHQRLDLFQRAPTPRPSDAQQAWLQALRFAALPGAPAQGALRFDTPIGPIDGPAELFSALLQRLAAGPAAFGELAALPAYASRPELLLQSLQLLMHQQLAHPLMPASDPDENAAHALTRWFATHGINLQVVAACGTAVRA